MSRQKRMSHKEVQDYLNTLLIPFSNHKFSIRANKKLSQDDKKALYRIVSDFECENEKYDYKQALLEIAQITSRYSKKRVGKTLPFLVKQVLFYMAAMCKACGFALQKDIIKFLKDNDAHVSHNFFSRMSQTPCMFMKMYGYAQPKKHSSYMGQKANALGFAIKNLAYQCGKYDKFVDLFGGSGAASFAVEKRKGAKYVYNELNVVVHNLFYVLADDKMHRELIEEMESLQQYLDHGIGVWHNINFVAETEKFYTLKSKHYDRELRIIKDYSKKFRFNEDSVFDCMDFMQKWVFEQPDDYVFEFEGYIYNKNALIEIFRCDRDNSDATIRRFCENYRLLESINDNHLLVRQSGFSRVYGTRYSETNGYYEDRSYGKYLNECRKLDRLQ